MRVLVACEFSGVVRDAFLALGHDAWSCDLLPTEKGSRHILGDVSSYLYPIGYSFMATLAERAVMTPRWDLMIAHPPCTHLAVSGARWFKDKWEEQGAALQFVQMLMDAPIPRICIENPVSVISTKIRKPDQIIQPWQFGHNEVKTTCLWLKGLKPLQPTEIVDGREQRIWRMAPSPDRWKNRSRTYEGIAKAMAEQWGNLEMKEAA